MKSWDEIIKELPEEQQLESAVIREKARMVHELIQARELRGWTQAQLASRTGMKQAAIARFEGGTNVPQIDTIMKIALALGYRIGLMGTSDQEAATAAYAEVACVSEPEYV